MPLHAPAVLARVGVRHDANPVHRAAMEDDTHVEPYSSFPGLFLGVYDGHGGRAAASLLRQLLHRYFLDELLVDHVDPHDSAHPAPPDDASACSTPPYDVDDDVDDVVPHHPLNTRDLDVASAFVRAYAKMDAALRVRRCFRVGATAVTCFVRNVPAVGRVLTTANCGDARAVLSRAGRPLRLSVDHRPCDEPERRRVQQAGGFVTHARVNGVLNVSRAFGDHVMKTVVVSTPYVNELVLGDMDDFVVLACDGLWDFVDDTTVIRIAQHAFDRGLDADEVAGVLVREALERKSTDNVSVMVVQFDMDE